KSPNGSASASMSITTRAVFGAEIPWVIATHMVWTAAHPAMSDVRPSPRPAAVALRFSGAVVWRSVSMNRWVARYAIPLPTISAAAVSNREVVDTTPVRCSANRALVLASTTCTRAGTTMKAARPATADGHHAPGAMYATMPVAAAHVMIAAGIGTITRGTASRSWSTSEISTDSAPPDLVS